KPLAADVDLAALASTTSEGCSGADIELICRKASLAAIREFLESPAARSATLEGFVIRAEHFLRPCASLAPSAPRNPAGRWRIETASSHSDCSRLRRNGLRRQHGTPGLCRPRRRERLGKEQTGNRRFLGCHRNGHGQPSSRLS